VGKLVQIREGSCLSSDSDRRVLSNHGHLWIVTEAPAKIDDLLIWTRSLATGYEYLWFATEYVTADKEDADADNHKQHP